MNSNCLEGIRCPECGSEEPFNISAQAVFRVCDDGTESYGDVEWDDNSAIMCLECWHRGKVKAFKTKGG